MSKVQKYRLGEIDFYIAEDDIHDRLYHGVDSRGEFIYLKEYKLLELGATKEDEHTPITKPIEFEEINIDPTPMTESRPFFINSQINRLIRNQQKLIKLVQNKQ